MFKPLHASSLFGFGLLTAGGVLAIGLACSSSGAAGAPAHEGLHASAQEEDEGEGDEQKVEMSKVPEAVKTSAMKYFGKLDGCKASTEKENGVLAYEIAGKTADGMELSLLCAANGQVAEVEREIAASALPAEGRANLEKRFPGSTTTMIESIEKHYFEVKLVQNGKRKELIVTASGRVWEAEEEGEKGEEGEED